LYFGVKIDWNDDEVPPAFLLKLRKQCKIEEPEEHSPCQTGEERQNIQRILLKP